MIQIFSAGRTGRTNQPKVVQEVLADLKIAAPPLSMVRNLYWLICWIFLLITSGDWPSCSSGSQLFGKVPQAGEFCLPLSWTTPEKDENFKMKSWWRTFEEWSRVTLTGMSFSVISKAPVLISWVSTAAEEKGTKKDMKNYKGSYHWKGRRSSCRRRSCCQAATGPSLGWLDPHRQKGQS